MKTLLSSEQLAPMIGLEVGTLAARRARKQSPEFVKVGTAVRYDPVVVAEWLEGRIVTPAPPAPIPTWLQNSPNRAKAAITSG